MYKTIFRLLINNRKNPKDIMVRETIIERVIFWKDNQSNQWAQRFAGARLTPLLQQHHEAQLDWCQRQPRWKDCAHQAYSLMKVNFTLTEVTEMYRMRQIIVNNCAQTTLTCQDDWGKLSMWYGLPGIADCNNTTPMCRTPKYQGQIHSLLIAWTVFGACLTYDVISTGVRKSVSAKNFLPYITETMSFVIQIFGSDG